jgi:hypothetical protein
MPPHPAAAETAERMSPDPDSVDTFDVAVGLAAAGARAATRIGRAIVLPARVASRVPFVGPRLRAAAFALGIDGQVEVARGRVELEAAAERAIAAPEAARTVDRALAGPLTEAIGRSLAEHRVAERFAGELVATGAFEHALIGALEHDEAQRLLERALASPGTERLVAAMLESRLVPELTDRILASEEMQAVLAYVAKSPELRRALTEQSSSLAEEMVDGLRGRTEGLDAAAETTIRGWLRRPRPSTG